MARKRKKGKVSKLNVRVDVYKGYRRSKRFIDFDLNGYVNEVKQSVKSATKEIRDLIYQTALHNAQSMHFKDNEVKLAGNEVTSDLDRMRSLLRSIITDHLEWESANVLKTGVRAMEQNFKESHIGIYYEFGTGEKLDPAGAWYESVGDVNPFRTPGVGAPIVSRSKHTIYKRNSGELPTAGGYWRDLGGNLRYTTSSKGGLRTPEFVKYIGADVEAYHWFSNAVKVVRSKIIKIYLNAVKSVDFRKFFVVKSNMKLGK